MRVGLFPGQGVPADEVARSLSTDDALLVLAQHVLGYDLSERVASIARKREALPTSVAQPAMFVVSMQSWSRAQREGRHFDFLAGHSLGEYSALAASGAVSVLDALQGVRVRAEATERTAQQLDGGMAAVLKLDLDRVEEIAARAGVSIANDNAPGQVVVAGERDALAGASDAVSEAGGRWKELGIAAPFHTEAMSPSRPELREQLDRIAFHPFGVPVVSNVTARPYEGPEEIRDLLVRQLTGRVRFRESMEWLWRQGVREFEDLGPGEVAAGLARRTFRQLDKETRGEAPKVTEGADPIVAAPESTDLHETIPARVVVAPRSGRFCALPEDEICSESAVVQNGQMVAAVDSGGERVPVRSPFDGRLAGRLVFDRQLIAEGQALFWGRTH